jgi:ParB family transcriptional regulator, chromosome partitioning protein
MEPVQTKPIDFFFPDPTNPRKDFPEDELRRLGASLRKKQLVPGIARKSGMIIDMECRWRAGKLVGLSTLDAILLEDTVSAAEVKEIQLITSLLKAGLKPYELFLGCTGWREANPGGTFQELAERINRDASVVSRIVSLERCIPAVKEAAAAGVLSVSDWYAMSKVGDQEQHNLLAAKRAGASRDDLERQGRQARNGNGHAHKKVSRVKCQLANACVTLAAEGDGLSLDDIIETLSEVLKEARKANDQGLSAKTFEKTLRDKAEK